MRYFIIILSFLLPLGLTAQRKKDFVNAADKAFYEKNYYAALVYYDEALEFDRFDTSVVFKAAESARLFNSYDKAASLYGFLIDTMEINSYPTAKLYYGQMLHRLGKFDEAASMYDQYKAEYGGENADLDAMVQKEVASIEMAKDMLNNAKDVKIMQLGADVNTSFSEVGGHMRGDTIYFTSMRFKEKNPAEKPARDVSKIFWKIKEETADTIPASFNAGDTISANSTITKDGRKMYYSICKYVNSSELTCKIYASDLDENGMALNQMRLPEPINMEGSTSTHPNISFDKGLGKYVLYFVSDREGGKGKLDIYYSIYDETFGFSQPINVEKINTAFDEITPFYHENSGILYFSSDGHLGLGGYDIFKSTKIADEYSDVVGLGIPFNSSYHDIFYSVNEYETKALFSSNREGAQYVDSYLKSCCYDIYEADINKILLDLNALTYDKITGRPLKNVTVRLVDKATGQEIAVFTNDDGNDHKFPIDPDRNYLVIAERENYYPDTLELSTFNLNKSESLIKKMYLSTDMMLLDAFTYTKVGKKPLEGTTVRLIDMTDGTVKDVVDFNELGNEFNFMLDRGKQYKLVATKDGYTEDIAIIDTRQYDKPGLIRQDLYLDKFVLPDLLPIALYFDNDYPDPNSKSTTTTSRYGTLVENYLNKKPEYKSKFIKPLPEDTRGEASEQIDMFFEGDVAGGYDKLKLFANNLLQELEAGNTVELIFKGFASPRADAKYNLTLGQRRVNSVKNELIFHGNEALQQYFLSGKLSITDISYGKELAPDDVSGAITDERNSIYNIKAAKERRVEILRAQRNN